MRSSNFVMPNPPSQSNPDPKKLEEVVVEKSGPLSPDDSVETAGERMRSVGANALPVAEGRKLVGVIDHPNPDRKAGGRGHDPRTTRVGETMSREIIYCYEDQNAEEADRIMVENNLNHLPVVDHDLRIVGIISRRDLRSPDSDGAAKVALRPQGQGDAGKDTAASDEGSEE